MVNELRVLILGGTGIIGAELSIAGIQAGYEVSVVSRGRRHSASWDYGVAGPEEIVADVHDSAELVAKLGMKRFDVVIDLVSFNPEQLSRNLTLFSGRCEQYIFVSSATVYGGVAEGQSLAEDAKLTENTWSYPALKIASERTLLAECERRSQNYTIVRPYITYSAQRVAFGAWETEAVLGRMLLGLPVAIGEQIARTTTSLTHARDLARGIARLVGNPLAMNEAFHIASPDPVTWAEVHKIASEVANVPLKIVEVPDSRIATVFPELSGKIADRLLRRVFDNGHFLRACPGFVFEFTPREGYAEAIASALERGLRPVHPSLYGRVDRLIAEARPAALAHVEIGEYARNLRRASFPAYLHYVSSRQPFFAGVKRTAKRLLTTFS